MFRINLAGKQFGKLTVSEYSGEGSNKNSKWKCKCACGKEVVVLGYRLKNGGTKSCGCLRDDVMTPRINKPYQWLFKILSINAIRNHREMNLSFSDFLEIISHGKCDYCGRKISWVPYEKVGVSHAYYVDRKNSELGYTKENSVACCTECNQVKSNKFSEDEMRQLGPNLRKIWENRKEHFV